LVLHLLKDDPERTYALSSALLELRSKITYCKECFNISDQEICSICAGQSREKSIICVVEDIQDVIAIENTNHYHGLYHVLGRIISPIEGIGPSELNIDSLISRVATGSVHEVIFALSATMQGDTTCFYITKRLKEYNIRITSIARGISIGGEL